MPDFRILIIDNYDSFTYNLVHEIGRVCPDAGIHVVQNDVVYPSDCFNYNCIVLSPGPGIPEESGKLLDVIRVAAGRIPILGVCLGHQALNVACGGQLKNLSKVFHGVSTPILVTDKDSVLFQGFGTQFNAGRYHSWVIDEETLPESFTITAQDESGNVMAIENKEKKMFGIQFHPESIMTPEGKRIIRNFLSVV